MDAISTSLRENAGSKMGDGCLCLGPGSQPSESGTAWPFFVGHWEAPNGSSRALSLQNPVFHFYLLQGSLLSVSGAYSFELGLLTMPSLKIDTVPDTWHQYVPWCPGHYSGTVLFKKKMNFIFRNLHCSEEVLAYFPSKI